MRRSLPMPVVIGGGVIGAAVAYNPPQLGMRDVVLCEKGDPSATVPPGRCGPASAKQWGSEENCLLAKASIDMFEVLADELNYPHDLEFKQKGYLMLAHTEKEWAQFQKNVGLQFLGIGSRLCTSRSPRDVPALNTDGIAGATFNARDGHANPFHVTRAYLTTAERLGETSITHRGHGD